MAITLTTGYKLLYNYIYRTVQTIKPLLDEIIMYFCSQLNTILPFNKARTLSISQNSLFVHAWGGTKVVGILVCIHAIQCIHACMLVL